MSVFPSDNQRVRLPMADHISGQTWLRPLYGGLADSRERRSWRSAGPWSPTGSSSYTASMLHDLERGGPVEADHILGCMLARAKAHELDTTLRQAADVHAKAYEQRRAAGRLPG